MSYIIKDNKVYEQSTAEVVISSAIINNKITALQVQIPSLETQLTDLQSQLVDVEAEEAKI